MYHFLTEHTKADHLDLVARLEAIDPEAAAYLRGLPEASSSVRSEVHFVASGILGCTFMWFHTPQGHRYWKDLAAKLGEKEV